MLNLFKKNKETNDRINLDVRPLKMDEIDSVSGGEKTISAGISIGNESLIIIAGANWYGVSHVHVG